MSQEFNKASSKNFRVSRAHGLAISGLVFYLVHILQQAQARDAAVLDDTMKDLDVVVHQKGETSDAVTVASIEALEPVFIESIPSQSIETTVVVDEEETSDEVINGKDAVDVSDGGVSPLLILGGVALLGGGIALAVNDNDSNDSTVTTNGSVAIDIPEQEVPITYDAPQWELTGVPMSGYTMGVKEVLSSDQTSVIRSIEVEWMGVDPVTDEATSLGNEETLVLDDEMEQLSIYAEVSTVLTNGQEESFQTSVTNPASANFINEMLSTVDSLDLNSVWEINTVVDEAGMSQQNYVFGEQGGTYSTFTPVEVRYLELREPIAITSDNTFLSVSALWDIEAPDDKNTGWDGLNFQVSTNGGETWSTLSSQNFPYEDNGYIESYWDEFNAIGGGQAYAGASDGFVTISDLGLSTEENGALPQGDVHIRVAFYSDELSSGEGVFISSIEVLENDKDILNDTISETGTKFELSNYQDAFLADSVQFVDGQMASLSLNNPLFTEMPFVEGAWDGLGSLDLSGSGFGGRSVVDEVVTVDEDDTDLANIMAMINPGTLETLDLSSNSFVLDDDTFTEILPQLKTFSLSGNVDALEELSFNSLIGIMPNLTSLDVTNTGVELEGELPDIQTMEVLVLSQNPMNINMQEIAGLESLQKLNLHQMDGEITNLDAISGMSGLTHLAIDNNDLGGVIPMLPASMIEVNLGNNNFTGTLETALSGGGNSLVYFRASFNDLTSEFPVELYEHPNLEYISLSENVTKDSDGNVVVDENGDSVTGFYGAIPDGISALKNLEWFYISGNQMSGPLPEAELISLLPENDGAMLRFWAQDQVGDGLTFSTDFVEQMNVLEYGLQYDEFNMISFDFASDSAIDELTKISDNSVALLADDAVTLLQKDSSGDLSDTVLLQAIEDGGLLTEVEGKTSNQISLLSIHTETIGVDPDDSNTYHYRVDKITVDLDDNSSNVEAQSDFPFTAWPPSGQGEPLNFFEYYGHEPNIQTNFIMDTVIYAGHNSNGQAFDLDSGYTPGGSPLINDTTPIKFDGDFSSSNVPVNAATIAWGAYNSEVGSYVYSDANLIMSGSNEINFPAVMFGLSSELLPENTFDLSNLYAQDTSVTLLEMAAAVQFVEVVGHKEAAVATNLMPGVAEVFHIDTSSDEATNLTDLIDDDINDVKLLRALDVDGDGDLDVMLINESDAHVWLNELSGGNGFSHSSASLSDLGLPLMSTQSIVDVVVQDSNSFAVAINDADGNHSGVALVDMDFI